MVIFLESRGFPQVSGLGRPGDVESYLTRAGAKWPFCAVGIFPRLC